ncbi:hypothetical protein M0657_012010 [Pyricularia oryzae]|nr:hypothetical protein M0657_012010 [Pyricularia oryzae]
MSALPFPALTPPSASETALAPYEVRFRHPAYPRDTPPLLLLSAADGIGIEYDLAVISCLSRPSDGILRGREYFFCIDGLESFHKYPVIPSFHNWRFPHDNLPPLWSQLQLPDYIPPPSFRGRMAVKERDRSCRVSGFEDATEQAHLVPAQEINWFISNGMERYCRFPTAVSTMDDDRNMLLLRRDVHYLFDGRRIAFVPKQFMSQPIQLIGHVLEPLNSMQLVHMYHNRNPQAIRGVSREFAFARFAWALFTDERIKFFGSHRLYKVLVWDSEQGRTETRDIEGAVVRSVAVVFDSSKRSQSRSVSPKKRSFAQAFGWGIEDSDEDGVSPESGEATQPQTFGWGQSAEDQCRGRTPFRRVRQGTKHSFGDISDGLSSVSSSQVETDIPVTPENKQAHGVDRPKRARKTPVTSDTTKSHFSDI